MIQHYKIAITNFLFNFRTHGIPLRSQLIAGFCLINIIILFPDIYDIFSTYGYIDSAINDQYVRWYEPSLIWVLKPLQHIGVYKNVALLFVITIYIVSLFFILIRYQSLVCSIIAWGLHIMMVNSSYYFSYGADYFITFVLFINIFFNIDTLFSNTKVIAVLHSFAIRSIQIHLCMVYFFAGFGKIMGMDWLNGDAIWYVIHAFAPEITNHSTFTTLSTPIFFMGIAWTTLIIELLYPILIYSKVKNIVLFAVIGMHLGIFFLLKLYTFACIMILLNAIAFGHYIKVPTRIRKHLLWKRWNVYGQKTQTTL